MYLSAIVDISFYENKKQKTHLQFTETDVEVDGNSATTQILEQMITYSGHAPFLVSYVTLPMLRQTGVEQCAYQYRYT